IVDGLGVLIGGRFPSELLKSGTERGSIEGLFVLTPNPQLEALLENSGLQNGDELIIRREVSSTGRNKIFINNQLATQSLLRDLRTFLVDIHGQGAQRTRFELSRISRRTRVGARRARGSIVFAARLCRQAGVLTHASRHDRGSAGRTIPAQTQVRWLDRNCGRTSGASAGSFTAD